jgi:signal transduction histidine kinase
LNIYRKRQRWKLLLSILAIIIIAISFWYTNQLVKKIALDERQKVELWADAIRNRAVLVKYTDELFRKYKLEERKRAEIWAQAIRNLNTTEDNEARNFYLKVVSENTNIPALIVDQSGKINYHYNVDLDLIKGEEYFRNKVKDAFSQHQPIAIDDGFSNVFYIYYQDSKIFTELKNVLDDIIKSFISEVVINSASVPVIITDSLRTHVLAIGNLEIELQNDTSGILSRTFAMELSNKPLEIDLPDLGKCYIYYENSFLLTQLKYFPVFQFIVIGLFILIAYFLFSFSRRAEQNQVWVGMSKETAHQLGTPLSALMAWMELLKMKGVDEDSLFEMGKDIKRLETITERFSKIGSVPEIEKHNVFDVLTESVNYMKNRASSKIHFTIHKPESDIYALMNVPLFDWVIENLIRNAIDAMEGPGSIDIEIDNRTNWVVIDISDSGKGIAKGLLKTVFEPGYTSKKRGWGLGLSLTKRIIEIYHKGKIFVKKSEANKGTTFRMLLKKA